MFTPPTMHDEMLPGNCFSATCLPHKTHRTTRKIVCAGAGAFEQAHISLTQGIYIGEVEEATEQLAAQWEALADQTDQIVPKQGVELPDLELQKAGFKPHLGKISSVLSAF